MALERYRRLVRAGIDMDGFGIVIKLPFWLLSSCTKVLLILNYLN